MRESERDSKDWRGQPWPIRKSHFAGVGFSFEEHIIDSQNKSLSDPGSEVYAGEKGQDSSAGSTPQFIRQTKGR